MTYRIFDIFREENRRYSIFYKHVCKITFKNASMNNGTILSNNNIYVKWLYNTNDSIPSAIDLYYFINLLKDFCNLSPEERYNYLYKKDKLYINKKSINEKAINLLIISKKDENDNNTLFAFIEQNCIDRNNIELMDSFGTTSKKCNDAKKYLKNNNVIFLETEDQKV